MKIDPRFKDTEFVVEADSFARLALWERFSTEALHKTELNTINWQQDSMGTCYQVGSLDNRPVNIDFVWAKLNNHLILFYHACSQVVDHKMVENWIEKYCNPQHNERRSHCDANNFAHAISYISNFAGWEPTAPASKA
jgi:hypothetical protein